MCSLSFFFDRSPPHRGEMLARSSLTGHLPRGRCSLGQVWPVTSPEGGVHSVRRWEQIPEVCSDTLPYIGTAGAGLCRLQSLTDIGPKFGNFQIVISRKLLDQFCSNFGTKSIIIGCLFYAPYLNISLPSFRLERLNISKILQEKYSKILTLNFQKEF